MIIIPQPGEDLFDLAKRCDALYICPKRDGKRIGPMVAYAGKDDKGENFIGDIYFNFRKIEQQPKVLEAFAEAAAKELDRQNLIGKFDTVCGIPQGGRTFGQELARILKKRFVYADKKPIPTEPGQKQEYDWNLSQFEFEPGERVAVAEDVFNNFQNTDHTLAAIGKTGVKIVLLVGALNRSPKYDSAYRGIPVVASVREAYPEFKQDDPKIVADIAQVGIEFEVKKNWPKLMAAMEQ